MGADQIPFDVFIRRVPVAGPLSGTRRLCERSHDLPPPGRLLLTSVAAWSLDH